MSQQKQLQTISLALDSFKGNGLVEPRIHKTNVNHRSRNSSQSVKSQTGLNPVPEVDAEEDNTNVGVTLSNGVGTRTSFTKNVPSRTNSVTSLTKSRKAYDNGGFEERTTQFERGYNDSTRSSEHESVASLQVQREQYCCCARWTVFERRLAVCVGVLAGMIFALAIAVGLLAGDNGVDEKFIWKP